MDNIADVLKHIGFLSHLSKCNPRKENRNFLLTRTKKFSNTYTNGDTQAIFDHESGHPLPPYLRMAFLPVICQIDLRF